VPARTGSAISARATPDRAEYDRCMADANRSYDSYKRETGTERK
jgi:hypothetical protein